MVEVYAIDVCFFFFFIGLAIGLLFGYAILYIYVFFTMANYRLYLIVLSDVVDSVV